MYIYVGLKPLHGNREFCMTSIEASVILDSHSMNYGNVAEMFNALFNAVFSVVVIRVWSEPLSSIVHLES